MNREELLAVSKPILFNTEMVKAILDGRKTQTRRAIKIDENKVYKSACSHGEWSEAYSEVPEHLIEWYAKEKEKPRYKVGDILYVRETWADEGQSTSYDDDGTVIYHERYFAYKERTERMKWGRPLSWRPSIHMPKQAARIFLRVTGVRVERLQEITDEQVLSEGVKQNNLGDHLSGTPIRNFKTLWDSTQKAPNKFMSSPYRWDRNPWVFVYEFERVES